MNRLLAREKIDTPEVDLARIGSGAATAPYAIGTVSAERPPRIGHSEIGTGDLRRRPSFSRNALGEFGLKLLERVVIAFFKEVAELPGFFVVSVSVTSDPQLGS
jgi:hypothetical protein